MKSKNLRIVSVLVVALLIIGIYLLFHRDPLYLSLNEEWIENNFPEKIDDDTILPYGYTMGVWPNRFAGEPIVMKMTYQKGPPQKFIQTMTQLWKPVEVEVRLEGPRTIQEGVSVAQWKKCFSHSFSCNDQKKLFFAYALPAHDQKNAQFSAAWFDSLDPLGARGVHFSLDHGTYFVDRYTVITEKGVAQNFTIQYVKSPIGIEGRDLFVKTLGGLKVKDDLAPSRAWIQNKIKSVKLGDIRALPELKARLPELIKVQNWIFSLLSVDPTQLASFFHLAGVTHMLGLDLMKAKEKTYENQEAWILNTKPLLESLIHYAKDFDPNAVETKQAVTNMEALLSDVLLVQQQMTSKSR